MSEQPLPIAGADPLRRGNGRERDCEDESEECVTHAAILLDVVVSVNAVRPRGPLSVTKIERTAGPEGPALQTVVADCNNPAPGL
jgi:hypothetical protein